MWSSESSRAHQAVLGAGEEAVGRALPPRHAALARAAGVEEARAEHDVGAAGDDRLDELGDDPRLVLAVGVEHHDDVGVALERLEVARLLVAAVADVVRVPDDVQRQLARELDGVVGRGVVDEDDLVDPRLGDAVDGRLERLGGVARGHHDDHLGVALAGRGAGQCVSCVSSIRRGSVSCAACRPRRLPEIFKAYDIRGLYGEQIDGEVAEASAGRSRACSPASRASRASELRVGLGRDMRLTAPELAARYRAGMRGRGRARARRRDGRHRDALLPRRLARSRRRADVHRLAQPEGLHGREARRARARSRCRGDARHRRDRGAARRRARRGAAAAARPRTSTSTPSSRTRALKFIDPSAIRPAEGRRSTAATAWPGRWSARSSSASTARARRRPTGSPTASSPTTSPTRCCRRTASFIIGKVRDEGADLGIAWDGDADRCFFIDETGEFVDRRLPHRAARRVDPAEAPGRGHPLRRARLARGRRHGRAAGGRALVNRVGHAFFKTPHARRGRRVRRRGLRPLLLRRLLQRRLGHDPGAADPRAARPEAARRCRELLAPYRSKYFISGEINSEVEDPAAKMAEIEERYADGETPSSTASRSTTTTGTSTCGRRTPSRCCG